MEKEVSIHQKAERYAKQKIKRELKSAQDFPATVDALKAWCISPMIQAGYKAGYKAARKK
jgi:hypothetical protein